MTIPAIALKFGLPAIYQVRLYVEDGGLVSYGPDALAMFVRAACYVDRPGYPTGGKEAAQAALVRCPV
jgi:hypothetical protein